jgi:hypothetical protein
MYPACEDHVQIIGGLRRNMFGDDCKHRLPERETSPRSDVPAALLSFEDESPRTVFQEHPQQTGGRDVEVRANSHVFEFPCLIGAAAGNDGVRRLVRADRFDLFRPDLMWNEPENADAPRA